MDKEQTRMLLEKKLLNTTYDNLTAREIVQQVLIDAGAWEVLKIGMMPESTVPLSIRAHYESPAHVLDTIASVLGTKLHADDNGYLHFVDDPRQAEEARKLFAALQKKWPSVDVPMQDQSG